MTYNAGTYDVAVIGAGHAGIEAALASARLGCRTLCFTVSLDAVGNMPCNPAVGGTGKGHLVRELDALGGEMAKAADRACIQYRLLNRGKGPAVWSLRAQADRRRYQEIMKHTLERQENLWTKQAEVTEVLAYLKDRPEVFLMTGHATVPELDAVVRKSAELGLKKVLVNHPQYHIGATIEDMVKWAELGAYIEINACVFKGIGTTATQPMSLAKEMLDAVPPEQMILDSDLGQKKNCTPVTGMARFTGFLMDELGLTGKQIDRMLKENPRKLLY